MNGWDRSVLSRAITTCTADSGVIEDCPVFQNEGRLCTDDENNACYATNPLPDEEVSPGTLSPYLPGCVAVTDGPAPATPADVVQGCLPGGGGGNPLPISNQLSKTISPPAPSSASISPHSVPLETSTTPLSSSVSLTASSFNSFNSHSSFPVMSTQPTTQSGPMTTPPPNHPTVPASYNQTFRYSSGILVTSAWPTTQLGPVTSPAEYLPPTVPTDSPIPFFPAGHRKHKHHHQHHHGHGQNEEHHETEGDPEHMSDAEYCDEEVPPSPRPSKRTRSAFAHRRHHLKGGHGSRLII
ncbi:hypothetical protein F5148DRAFT_236800 [Russula earlei]|uniref:Uncharacterized protein n=1 Tax=Russula earlei TaxID=71964 RepID=A0ACC0U671_9AGAM|nr:hypothetical protein F5148DRAFT_236800 [Russula earlei]